MVACAFRGEGAGWANHRRRVLENGKGQMLAVCETLNLFCYRMFAALETQDAAAERVLVVPLALN